MLSFNEFSKVLSFSPQLGNNDNGATGYNAILIQDPKHFMDTFS